MRNILLKFLAGLIGFYGYCSLTFADEGLWLPNRFPINRLEQTYRVKVDPALLDRLQRSSVRLSSGGSGSFVSSQGLILTNHHVAADCIQKLSDATHDYMRSGFYARSSEEERTCPGLEANVLIAIEDVTESVKAVAPPTSPAAEANRLRKAKMSEIEKQCTERTGYRCEVVTLYSGEQYHLYMYKRYTDVRLVFAPEVTIAAFGGDPDNFTYPRYCLDIAFLRAYENSKPARTEHYLRWSPRGVQEGSLAIVSGHPGRTNRLDTYAALEFYRDRSYPLILRRLEALVKALLEFSAQGDQYRRMAQENLMAQQNSLKAYRGFYAGLKDASLMARKRAEEVRLRSAVNADPKLRTQYGAVWEEVAAAYRRFAQFYRDYFLLESGATRGSELLRIARDVLRYAEERLKPDGDRLREYREAARESLERRLYSPAPIHLPMETAVLAEYLRFLREELGPNHAVVKAVLAGRSPREAAAQYVGTTRLTDVAERKRLVNDIEALRSSEDGMIRLARLLDAPARQVRKRYEDEVEAVLTNAATRLAQARFAVHGPEAYPDATFTLRFTYGEVKGYRAAGGQQIPWATDFAGLFARATGKDPYQLPDSWLSARSRLNLRTPFNFVTTCDVHGGNSGSPTVDAEGYLIGVVFDGNLESLPNQFVYTDERARAVHVAVNAIEEALRIIYRAERILQELGLKP